uniref:Uncharacterized protein n=1 Tax=Solanum lycopersicum TaxID=4081 RepID=A0A3Q7FT40_SOLLC
MQRLFSIFCPILINNPRPLHPRLSELRNSCRRRRRRRWIVTGSGCGSKDIGNSREGVVGLETVMISDEKLLRMMKRERHRKEKSMILTKAGDFVSETRLFSEPDKLILIDDVVRRIEDDDGVKEQ